MSDEGPFVIVNLGAPASDGVGTMPWIWRTGLSYILFDTAELAEVEVRKREYHKEKHRILPLVQALIEYGE